MLEQMSGQQIITLINYIAQAGEAQDVQTLLFGLAQRVPQHGETLMTFAEHMKQIGLAEGMQEGIQQGMQEGKRAAMLDIARAMLLRGFDSGTVMEITGLSKDELQQLAH